MFTYSLILQIFTLNLHVPDVNKKKIISYLSDAAAERVDSAITMGAAEG